MNKSELIRYYKKIITRLIVSPLKLIPTNKHRVLLINNMSGYYADNLKYIAEGLRERGKTIELIYAGRSLACCHKLRNKCMKAVELNTVKYFYYGMTSRVLVTNSGGISYLPLKKNQYVINTWHGGGAYKKMGIDMYEDTALFRKDMALAAKETDLLLTTCERFKNAYCKAMLEAPEKFWSIGMPRNDCLKKGDEQKRQIVRKTIGLREEDRLVLFAPTYRKINDDYFNDSVAISYGIDEKMVCDALHERFGGRWIFAYRYHPCIVNREKAKRMENVADFTDYDDMQELLLASDVLINDFSSSMWDFMLTGKPCFIFAKDLQHYIKSTELYTPVSEWTFSIEEKNEQLAENIKAFDEKHYKSECDKHYELLGGCETGEATKLVCKKIEQLCK